MDRRYLLASAGEAAVACALTEQGWSILARNFRHIGFEIDLIARKTETVIGVEVKARTSRPNNMARIQELMPGRKVRCLIKGLRRFCHLHKLDPRTLRLDLAVAFFHAANAKTPYKLSYFPGVHSLYGEL